MEEYVANLSAVASYYRSRNRQHKFCASVRLMEDAAGAYRDITLGIEMVRAYRSIENKKDILPPEIYGFALGGICANAILLYARATRVRSNARGAVDLRPHLPENVKIDHDHIHDLRDEAIAHLGTGKRKGSDVWSDLLITAHITGARFEISYQSKHALMEEATINRLLILLPITEDKLKHITEHYRDSVVQEMQNLVDNDSFVNRVHNMPFDHDDFYKGNMLKKDLMGGKRFLGGHDKNYTGIIPLSDLSKGDENL